MKGVGVMESRKYRLLLFVLFRAIPFIAPAARVTNDNDNWHGHIHVEVINISSLCRNYPGQGVARLSVNVVRAALWASRCGERGIMRPAH
jgi:hypothetical protein